MLDKINTKSYWQQSLLRILNNLKTCLKSNYGAMGSLGLELDKIDLAHIPLF